MGLEWNFGSGAEFWVGIKILGREQNFRSGGEFWVRSEILGWEQNFGLGAKFLGWGKIFMWRWEIFVLGVKFWVQGENILEMGQFKAKKNYRIGGVGGGGVVGVVGVGQVNNSGTLLGSKFQSATNKFNCQKE